MGHGLAKDVMGTDGWANMLVETAKIEKRLK